MNRRSRGSCVLTWLASLLLAATAVAQAAYVVRGPFEKQVRAYAAEDRVSPPPRNAILFAGDSQFFRWKTIHEDLPGYTLINRGIDGFQLSDLLHYEDQLVLSYAPRLIVLHIGGNDVHNGKSAAQLLAGFETFVARVRARYPRVPIVFSSLTPGPARWDEAPQRVEANEAIRKYIATRADLEYIDLWNAMLTPDGKPREDIWVEDRVHPNHAGYLLRVELTRPLLGSPDIRTK
jgi:hypothetical protein